MKTNLLLGDTELNVRNLKRLWKISRWKLYKDSRRNLKKHRSLAGMLAAYCLLIYLFDTVFITTGSPTATGISVFCIAAATVSVFDHLVVSKYTGHFTVSFFETMLILSLIMEYVFAGLLPIR